MKARGYEEPRWWNLEEVQIIRQNEIDSLSKEVNWQTPAAKLLGLDDWPVGFEEKPSAWVPEKSFSVK